MIKCDKITKSGSICMIDLIIKGALPWPWEEYCNTNDLFSHNDGTHDVDIHSYEDNTFDIVSHTHCDICDEPFESTMHFWGDGMICMKCIKKKYGAEYA